MTRSVNSELDQMLRDHYSKTGPSIDDDDPRFDAEVEALLRPGRPDLLRNVRPEVLEAMGVRTAENITRPIRTTLVGYAAAVALAAAIAITVLRPIPHLGAAPTGPILHELSGGLTVARGTSGGLSRRYRPESTLRIVVSQPPGARIVAGALGVFEVAQDQRLRWLKMSRDDQYGGNTGATFTANAQIKDIFGPRAGARKLALVVVAEDMTDVRQLDGELLSSITSRSDLLNFVEEIEIVTSVDR